MRVLNASRGQVLAEMAAVADGFWSRLKGLLGRDGLRPGEALWLTPCSSVHCWFMAFPIDVAFVGSGGRVLAVYHGLRPWRASGWVRGAAGALELPAGTLARTQTRVGDVLRFQTRARGPR